MAQVFNNSGTIFAVPFFPLQHSQFVIKHIYRTSNSEKEIFASYYSSENRSGEVGAVDAFLNKCGNKSL